VCRDDPDFTNAGKEELETYNRFILLRGESVCTDNLTAKGLDIWERDQLNANTLTFECPCLPPGLNNATISQGSGKCVTTN